MGNVERKGIHQGDLVTLMKLIQTNFDAVLAHLDSDTGVTDVNYASTLALANPTVRVESAGTGLGQGDKYDFLDELFTDYNALVAKLNTDAGVTDTDYAVLTSTVGEGKTIFSGMNQTDLVTALQTFITGIATLNAKLDADAGVGSTDYAATYDVADTVDDSGA